MKPMISSAAATGLLEAIEATGTKADRVFRALNVSPSLLTNRDGYIPCELFARLLEEAARATGDDCFGLHFGERFNPKDIGALAYVVLNSATVALADEQVARYLKIYNQAARVSLTVDGKRALMSYVLAGLGFPARQQNEYGMAVRLNTIRMMVGSRWAPLEVQFAHPKPENISEHERIFRAPVLFDFPTNSLVTDSDFLDCRVPAADPALYRIIKRYLEDVLEALPEVDGVITEVRRAIAEILRDGEPSLARIAKKMGVGPRTLQRQLKAHQTKCKKLVDETRRLFALNYLRDPKNTLAEVAFLLGYSEASAFNRAFKRWTGSTPLVYRRELNKPAAAAKTSSDSVAQKLPLQKTPFQEDL
jgi:AraC-like DNA-binding protein